MSEKTKVWIRTSTLDTIIFGKNKTSTTRGLPGGASNGFDDSATMYSTFSVNSHGTTRSNNDDNNPDLCKNWGWSRGYIVNDNSKDDPKSAAAVADDKGKEMIKVYITDQDSTHCNTEIDISFSETFSKGDLVMDNSYGEHHPHYYFDDSDDEDEDGDDYGYDYGGGNDDGKKGKPEDKYPDDLITLTHLHEASVVYCLRRRYTYDKIYTSTGPILIALNPFKSCKTLYSEAIMKQYWDRGEKQMLLNNGGAESSSGDDEIELPPHVYATADRSFRNMMSKLNENTQVSSPGRGASRRGPPGRKAGSSSEVCNQSILVSGESGAGKTVTTKFIMQYLATLSKRSASDGAARRKSVTASGETTDIEQQVLQSNPILESFGNARTIRNDNSSRFGKFIEIQFTDTGSLVGANIETYLLEKVRLISQADGERNYHIFYEILQGMEDEGFEKYFIGDLTAEDFKMTNQSETYERRDGVCDYDTYQDLLNAMQTMGFEKTEQDNIWSVTCALLHASNLTFNSIKSGDESEIDKTNVHFKPILSLLGLSADDFNRALCYFSIVAGRERHMRSNTKEQAEKGLLALIKATYGALFTYIVKRVNESITVEDTSSKGRRGNSGKLKAAASIGVLDIFGFESFKRNSFEQLCINYCNETLQQQFNMFVLKNEQDIYEKEGIQWSFISFPDNQDALDLIDKRGMGILSILDDQCKAPGTTDKTFINAVYQKLSRHARFEANRKQVGARKFAISHYAGSVEYTSNGFVEKNRDDLPKETTELLLSSSNEFVKSLAQIISGPASEPKARGPSKSSKLTVGGQFSRQLQELRHKIDNTLPHYVRCLKPNDELVPDHFDPLVVADQLRCAGVIEAVRVSRVGYPQRYPHARFFSRYRIIGQSALKQAAKSSRRRKPVEVLVESIAAQLSQMDSDEPKSSKEPVDLVSVGIQVGKTKVFLRRKAYEGLEVLRNRRMRDGAVKIQALGRGYIVKREYSMSRNAIVTLQCMVRTMIAKRVVEERRRKFNAIKIQTAYRRAVALREFVAKKLCSQWLQKVHRGNVGRAKYLRLNKERKAILIQKIWRMSSTLKYFKKQKSASLTLQCAWRCTQSRRELKKLKMAAKDLSNATQERDTLREENRKLQKALADAISKGMKAKSCASDFETEKENLLAQIKQLESDCALKDKKMDDKDTEMTKMKEDLKVALKSIDDSRDEQENIRANALNKVREAEKRTESIEAERNQLQSRIHQLEESSKMKDEETITQKKEMQKLKDDLRMATESLSTRNEENIDSQELADAEKRVDDLENERNELEERIIQLEEACAVRDREMDELKAEMIKNEDESSLPDHAIEKANEVKASFETEKRGLVAQINELEQSCISKDNKTHELTQEIENLKRQLKKVSKRMNRFQTLESKAGEELDKLIDDCSLQSDVSSSNSRAVSPMFSLAADSDEEKERDAHIENLEKEISKLKKKLADANEIAASSKNEASLKKEVEKLRKKMAEAKKAAAEEILTLQDEVERLNKEVRTVKVHEQDDAIEITGKYKDEYGSGDNNDDDKVKTLINSLMEKDAEIIRLRRQIDDLREQYDDATMSMLSDSRFHDDDDRSVISKIFTGGTRYSRPPRSLTGSVGREERSTLRRENLKLKKEVEELKVQLEDAQFELEDERERSGKEIKAFGLALQGVDELRSAAEAMSREINMLKQRDDDDVPDDPFEEVSREKLENGESVVQPELDDRRHRNRGSENPWFWNKMKLSVRSLNEDVIPEDSDYKERYGRRKGKDDRSVLTSFF